MHYLVAPTNTPNHGESRRLAFFLSSSQAAVAICERHPSKCCSVVFGRGIIVCIATVIPVHFALCEFLFMPQLRPVPGLVGFAIS